MFCDYIKDMAIIFLPSCIFRSKIPLIVYLIIPRTAKYFPKYSEPNINEKVYPKFLVFSIVCTFFNFHISNPWLVTLKIPILYKATHLIENTREMLKILYDLLTHGFLIHSCPTLLITFFTIAIIKCVYRTFYLL